MIGEQKRRPRHGWGSRIRATALASRVLMAGGIVSGALCPIYATWAAAAEQTTAGAHVYAIGPGPLGDVLVRFAAESGVQLVFEPTQFAGRQSAGLQGSYSLSDGFRHLLAGAGFTAVSQGKGVYAIQSLPVAAGGDTAQAGGTLPTVEVTAQTVDAEPSTRTEGSHSYAASAVGAGGKTARDFTQVQQSVSVITQQRIQDQNLNNLKDALDQTTGINVQAFGNMGSNIYSRGLPVTSFQFDGGAANHIDSNLTGNALPDLAPYDHVEVLRGADGLFAGAGEASGTVNLVRKRPLDHFQFTTDTTVGSWDHYRQQVDLTSPLNQAGTLRGRLVAAQTNEHHSYDIAKDRRTVVYGVIEADVSDDATIAVGINYNKYHATPNDFGLPRFTTGASLGLPRDTCFCTPWSTYEQEQSQFFTEYNQRLVGDWKLKINASYEKINHYNNYAWALGTVNPYVGTTRFWYADEMDHARQKLVDATITGSFDVLGHKQELVAGLNWTDLNDSGVSTSHGSIALDALHFNAADYPASAWPTTGYSVFAPYGERQWGGYATLRSELTSGLHSIVGGRYSHYRYNYSYSNYDLSWNYKSTTVNGYSQPHVFTPYGGLTYDLTPTASVYASYARIFQPQGGDVDEQGSVLKPVTGASYEVGMKARLGEKFNGTLAVYQTDRNNTAVKIGDSDSYRNCCYRALAKVQIRGIEGELTGEPLPGWDVSLGYTFSLGKYKSGYDDQDGADYTGDVYPRHLLKLWSMYRLPVDDGKWRVGGGVNLTSGTTVSGSATVYDNAGNKSGTLPFQYRTGFYPLVALRAEYRIDQHWSAALNVNNVLDRVYYSTLAGPGYGNFYGDPRNFMLTLHSQW